VFFTVVNVALRQRIDISTKSKSERPNADFERYSAASSRYQVHSCFAETNLQLTETELISSRRFAAIDDVIVPLISSAQTAAMEWVEQSAEHFLTDVEVSLARQHRYVQKMSLNHWLLFPRALYNKTMERSSSYESSIVANSSDADEFWNFLRLAPSEVELSLWTTRIRERLVFSVNACVVIRGIKTKF